MCKSIAEGGQRCASHTRAGAISALRTLVSKGPMAVDDREQRAFAEYASTPAGRRDLRGTIDRFEQEGDYERAALLETTLKEGENLRQAAQDLRDVVTAGGKRPGLSKKTMQAIRGIGRQSNLTPETTEKVFADLLMEARERGITGTDGLNYAVSNLKDACRMKYRELAAASSTGGWGTWRFKRVLDPETGMYDLYPLRPTGEPPGVSWTKEFSDEAVATGKTIYGRMGDENSGDGYVFLPNGQTMWGLYGASGIMLRHIDDDGTERFFLAQRGANVDGGGGTWAIPGGALDRNETPEQGAVREFEEEIYAPGVQVNVKGSYRDALHDDWAYTTVATDVDRQFAPPKRYDWETSKSGWFTREEIAKLPKHPSFEAALPNVYAAYDNAEN